MKIVHVEAGKHLYGGARQVAYLLAGLGDCGVDNVLVCRPGAEVARAAPRDTRLIELPMRGDLDWRTVARLRAVLRREQPDLLHVHSRAGADLFGGLAARAERVPALVTRRVDNREPQCWARPKLGRFARVAAISEPIRSGLVALGLAPARISTIASAVDAAHFASRASARALLERRFGLRRDTLALAAVGQLIARKGHDVLLAALPAIVARQPRVRLVIFGRGPAERALQRSIARLGLGTHVVLAGFEPALARYLAGFDLLVHPARREGLGLAVLEAASCGVPVVASRAGGLVDALGGGATGRLVPPDDAPALAAATLRLLGDPSARHALAERARRRVREHHTIESMTSAYLRLYREVLSPDECAGRTH